MNENVNISFIPKKPLARDERVKHHKPVLNIVFLISFVIAFVAIGMSTMRFMQIESLEQEKLEKIKDLEDYNKKLEAEDIIKNIEENRQFAKKINIVKGILGRHVESTKIFNFLERTTPTQVSFKNFDFSNSGDVVQLKMNGQAASYEVLAALSGLYKQEKETLLHYSLTNFSLDDTGSVSFNFSGIFTPSLVAYDLEENEI